MKNVILTKEIDNLIYLLSCAANNIVPDIIRVNSMDMESIYQLASSHSLVSMVAYSLERVIELPYSFDQQKKKAIRKLALFDIERYKLFEQFEKNEIWYSPLKGVILMNYYPQYGMREMADNDILCNAERMLDIKRIMLDLGFKCIEYNKRVDDTYIKAPVAFEMHRFLFEEREFSAFYLYFKDIKNKLTPIDNRNYEYRFKPEDFYIYMIAHEYKHYTHGGTGIRSLLDTYLFLKRHNEQLDWKYINQELSALSLTEFENINKKLAIKAFSGIPMDDEEKQLFMYYVSSGVYGTEERSWKNRISKNLSGDDSESSKRNYLFDRVFIHGEALKNCYPFVYHYKILLPGLYVYRFIKAIFVKPKKIWTEYKRVKHFKY